MMLVDCQTCPVRDVHCADCMVTALTTIPLRRGATAHGPETDGYRGPRARSGRSDAVDVRPGADDVVTAPLDRAERRAVSAFVAAGLVSTTTANAARAELDPVEVPVHHRVRRAV